MSRWFSILGVSLLSVGALYNSWAFYPNQMERYLTPTRLSLLVQKHAPWIYRPPASVFASRYGNGVATAAVVGPDCRRLAVADPARIEQDGYGAVGTRYCERLIDLPKLADLIRAKKSGDSEWTYSNLTRDELASLNFEMNPGDVIETSQHKIAAFVTRGGWGALEPWGVWSIGKRAKLILPVNADAFGPQITVSVTASALIPNQIVTVVARGQQVAELKLTSDAREHSFTVPLEVARGGMIPLELNIAHPVAPADVIAGSSDPRPLGIGLLRIRLT